MNVLRRMSTTRLLALIGALAATVLVAGIAVASSRSGPTPPRRPLDQAIHRALTAGPVRGMSARITFTNHLFPTGSLGQGSGSALLAGATGRLWIASDGRFRVELQSESGDTQVMGDRSSVRVYDASSNSVYVLALPHTAGHGSEGHNGAGRGVPTVAEISRAIARLAGAAHLTGAIPGDVAGRPVYSVRVSPSHDGGLLGGLQLAWDADRGIPLKVAVYSRGDSAPVLSLTATEVHYGSVPASDLSVRAPAGAHVTRLTLPTSEGTPSAASPKAITGLAAVRDRLGFALAAPDRVAGLPRRMVRMVDAGGRRAAVVVYGQGLGAIAVIEQSADTQPSGGDPLASLPRVSIDGASGRELATALGTLLRFQRGGVSYTLVGSVPPVAAEAAARALR